MMLHDAIVYTSLAVETVWVLGICTVLLLTIVVIMELVWPQ